MRRSGPVRGARGLLAAALAAALLLPAAARAEPTPQEQEIIAALRENLVNGYHEGDAAKILALYHEEAQIATFTRGVVGKETFASLVRESLAAGGAVEAALEIGAFSFDGEAAQVPLRLILTKTDAAGKRKVTADRLYCRLRKEGTWRIVLQTYRGDYTLPPLSPTPGMGMGH
ncbi:MAG TPA: hypothetical protein VI078_04430 [bacterium]